MTPILKVTDTISGHSRIEVLRKLTMDDFDFVDTCPRGDYEHGSSLCNSVTAGCIATIREDLLEHIREALGIELVDGSNGMRLSVRDGLAPFTYDWDPTPRNIQIHVHGDVGYQGIPKTNAAKREAKWELAKIAIAERWSNDRDRLVNAKIQELQNALESMVEREVENFDGVLSRLLVDVSVNQEWLEDARGEVEQAMQVKLAETVAAVKAAREALRAIQVQVAEADRDLLLASLLTDDGLSPAAAETAKSMREEARGKIKDSHRMFGF